MDLNYDQQRYIIVGKEKYLVCGAGSCGPVSFVSVRKCLVLVRHILTPIHADNFCGCIYLIRTTERVSEVLGAFDTSVLSKDSLIYY